MDWAWQAIEQRPKSRRAKWQQNKGQQAAEAKRQREITAKEDKAMSEVRSDTLISLNMHMQNLTHTFYWQMTAHIPTRMETAPHVKP